MQAQLDKAFAQVNTRVIESYKEFAIRKLEGYKDAMTKANQDYLAGSKEFAIYWPQRNAYSFDSSLAAIAYYGSKSMMNLIHGRGREGALAAMYKNAVGLIAKRDAQIIKALNKKGIFEIPEFELVEMSDGIEGVFYVAGKKVVIRTIVAGGYNIQCLHNRTTVKVS